MNNLIHIKNMVCPRCVGAVQQILIDMGVIPVSVKLGEVMLEQDLTTDQLRQLSTNLDQAGFELLEDKSSQLISEIKTLIVELVHHQDERSTPNLSDYLASTIGREYSALSKLFSSVEGMTIERFMLKQRIEKVKELLTYEEYTLSEIAHRLGYSSVSHLSGQFKKETGLTPTQFKNGMGKRRPIDF